ncbi:putative transmembrane protein [Paramagnetospirillum magnetotacticum MS-1]|uniref:Putative transmembrane protein n=1 Tax=Paramagnetospirillum magnetotacticum MS-1 TaxID=272627 RepID=A0A0C2YCB2_PARME|nr:TIGR02186 family protein [Paramagnetospirillum magnetotacticum]KIL97389.1 putative transmembrane protein [Paramagnetospirillum magnetotacticum MS-1]
MKKLLLALLVLLPLGPASAVEPLVADLSKHLVAITTGFAGTDVLLFGAIEEMDGGKSGDVVVVVRGPHKGETLRRKDRTAGIWINSGIAKVDNAPSFYQVASTRPLDQLAPPAILDRHQIGLDHLDLDIRVKDGGADTDQYRQALFRLNQKKGLYGDKVLDIGMLSQRLFRTDVHFPANVPVGVYMVEVYLMAGGQVISAQTTPLVVSKIGIGADVFDFAHHQAAAYGLIAIALAALAGWLAAVVFKKA